MRSPSRPRPVVVEQGNDGPALRVLVAGGGVAGLEALLALRELAGERVDLTLLTPDEDFVYRPLEALAPFSRAASLRIPWSEIAADLRASHIPDALTSVDTERRVAHTAAGRLASYDVLVVAAGARREIALRGALTMGMPGTSDRLSALMDEVSADRVGRIAFVAPVGVSWTLPIYELALLTATHARAGGATVKLAVITAEPEPLQVLGPAAGTLARELLDRHDIGLYLGIGPERYRRRNGALPRGAGLPIAGAVVAVPRLEGPHLAGLPATADGFLPVDGEGRVQGEDAVYAAGDVTSSPLKQGGVAAQQADDVAAHIALRATVTVPTEALDPVLRALMRTGGASRFLRHRRSAGANHTATPDEASWWPPAKFAGRRVSSYLAERGRGRDNGR